MIQFLAIISASYMSQNEGLPKFIPVVVLAILAVMLTVGDNSYENKWPDN